MDCLHCRQPKRIMNRGLCSTCYRIPVIRKKYPKQELAKPLMEGRKPCVHCKTRNGIAHKCGLCIRCYACVGIRTQYSRRGYMIEANYRGPTLEQLEALIASRYPTMPKEPKPPRAPSEPLAVRRMIRTGRAGMMVRKTSSEW